VGPLLTAEQQLGDSDDSNAIAGPSALRGDPVADGRMWVALAPAAGHAYSTVRGHVQQGDAPAQARTRGDIASDIMASDNDHQRERFTRATRNRASAAQLRRDAQQPNELDAGHASGVTTGLLARQPTRSVPVLGGAGHMTEQQPVNGQLVGRPTPTLRPLPSRSNMLAAPGSQQGARRKQRRARWAEATELTPPSSTYSRASTLQHNTRPSASTCQPVQHAASLPQQHSSVQASDTIDHCSALPTPENGLQATRRGEAVHGIRGEAHQLAQRAQAVKLPHLHHAALPGSSSSAAGRDLSPYGSVAARPARAAALQALKATRQSQHMTRGPVMGLAAKHSEHSMQAATVPPDEASPQAVPPALAPQSSQLPPLSQICECTSTGGGAGTDASAPAAAQHDEAWQERLQCVRQQLAARGVVHPVVGCREVAALPAGVPDRGPAEPPVESTRTVAEGRRPKGPGDHFANLSLEEVMAQGKARKRRPGLGRGQNPAFVASPGLLEWGDDGQQRVGRGDEPCARGGTQAAATPVGNISLVDVLRSGRGALRRDDSAEEGSAQDTVSEPAQRVLPFGALETDLAWGGSLEEVLRTGAGAERVAQERSRVQRVQNMWANAAPAHAGIAALARQSSSNVHNAPPRVRHRRPLAAHTGTVREPRRPPITAQELEAPSGRALLGMLQQFVYKPARAGQEASDGDTAHECAVCLDAFQHKQLLRRYRGCRHCFHERCIETWLNRGDARCPLCRWNPLSAGW
jgi:Ring finger domain